MIKGIDYYGSSYWILLFNEIGGYYDVNDVEIVNYDFVNGTIIKKIEITDTHIWPTGIVHDGKYIWIGFSNNAATNMLYKIDPESDTVLDIFKCHEDIDDITFDGEYIYLCGFGNTIVKFDSKSENFEQEFKFGQNQNNSTGVSYHDEQLWIAFNQGKLIGIFDINGMQTGFAEVADFKEWNEQPRLSILENELIVIENGTAKVMSIVQK